MPLTHIALEQFYRLGRSASSAPRSCNHCCKSAPLFSITSKMPLSQPFFFHAFALLPGGGIPSRPQKPVAPHEWLQTFTHLHFLCFHALTHCPICKSLVLMTLQQYPGVVGL